MREKLFIDFETRSLLDLKAVGSHRYCSDASTEVLLCSYAFDDEPVTVCETLPDEVLDAIENEDVVKIAHNAEFDMCVCKYVLGLCIDFTAWFDSAYAAAYYGYPRKLMYLAVALNTTRKASQDEMFFFSKPKAVKKGLSVNEFNRKEDFPELWEKFVAYAAGDVEVMRECCDKIPPLPELEVVVMRETFEMNFAGVSIDIGLATRIYLKSKDYAGVASEEALRTYGIENLRSTIQVQAALAQNGCFMPSLNKKEREGVSHPILDLRDQATGAAFSKIPKVFERICSDGRLHGEFVGHGAHTGRWSSRGAQLQNWARILSEVSELLDAVRGYSHLREHMRLCLGYAPGQYFTCADLSQIEARIVAWLAGCKWRIEAFANNEDIYARSAEKMFGVKNVGKGDKERQYGKCAELGLGFGGGAQAIKNVQPDFYREVGGEKVEEIVRQWRLANPEVCRLWRTVEQAFREAVKTGRCRIPVGGTDLLFRSDGKNSSIVLPSGRALYYRNVSIVPSEMGSDIVYLDYSKGGEYPTRAKLWGGTILENIAQAIARDVIADIMRRVRERVPGVASIGSVHDEIWYQHPPELKLLDILLEEMARPIAWAPGLVTKGEGFTSDRYRK